MEATALASFNHVRDAIVFRPAGEFKTFTVAAGPALRLSHGASNLYPELDIVERDFGQ